MFYSLSILLLCLLAGVGAQDPGLPVPNPSISYWQIPPLEGIADHQSTRLPEDVDVVIIGSGITGASVAHHLLQMGSQKTPLKIAMFEARQACSGATGRNGGHIRPITFAEYSSELQSGQTKSEATKIARFRAAHIDAMLGAAGKLSPEGRFAAEARRVDSLTTFWNSDDFEEAAIQLELLKKDLPDLASQFKAWNATDAERISLLPGVSGLITGSPQVAAAIWPYRFIAHLYKDLLAKYPTFTLDTHTPVYNISLANVTGSNRAVYGVTTSRGTLRTRHVVHAGNAWIPHLVQGLKGKVIGYELSMSAHVGGQGLPKAGEWPSYQANGSLPGGRAWDFYGTPYGYMVQMPRNGEFMLGGGPTDITINGPGSGAAYDDSGVVNHLVSSYFSGAVGDYFGFDRYGAERTDFPEPHDNVTWKGHTKRVWKGIDSRFVVDGYPVVGRLPTSATKRAVNDSAKGREWISTSYDGEGMCYAWLCAKALVSAILDFEAGNSTTKDVFPDWFPMSHAVSETRLSSNNYTMGTLKRSATGRGLEERRG